MNFEDKPLTPRELGILRMVAEGKTNLDIAKAVHFSEFTVKTHLSRMALKLGTGSRASMVAIGFRDGLLRWANGKLVEVRDAKSS